MKDRFRIKDATHVIANIAVPTALALVARTRDKLLAVAEPSAPLLVARERVSLEMLRKNTQSHQPADRLAPGWLSYEKCLSGRMPPTAKVSYET